MLDNPVVCKDTDYLAVWMYLLLNATHKEMAVMFCCQKITIHPGQLITGRKKIAEKFNISESKVQRILKTFESEQQIEQQNGNKNRLITVLNWSNYQQSEQQTEQQLNNKRTTTEQQLNTNKKEKNVKNEKNNINTLCKPENLENLFEELWKLYPVKKGKGQVSVAAKQRLLKVGRDEMVRAIDRYKAELAKDSEWRRPQNGSTFFNSGYLDYLDDNYVPQTENRNPKKGTNVFNDIPKRDYDFDELEKQLLARR